MMIRPRASILFALLLAFPSHSAHAALSGRTLVLPLRSIGVSDATSAVSHELLVGSLGDLGVEVASPTSELGALPSGADACDAPECAAALGRQYGVSRVVYGSLSKLGGKIIARLNVLRVEETAPYYRDQLTATSEEDLDTVMRRFAEGIAAGRPNSDRASVESVTQAETFTSARRAARTGFGVRAGFLFPTGNSFGGADRMTNLHAVFKYEVRDFQIESTPVLGFSWGEGNFDWTILDLSATRIFGTQDLAGYLGVGIGVHSVSVENRQAGLITSPYYPSYYYSVRQTATAPSVDLIAGLLGLRTYDFEAVLEIRYHFIFENFDEVGGNGANGIMVTFGTSR